MSIRTLVAAALALTACSPRVEFSAEEIARAPMGRGFPPGFLFGVATAPHQVEGGNQNDWTDWEESRFPDGRPHIAKGDSAAIACDSWNRYPEDIAALEHLGANAYRIGIEWSRLEPSQGEWDLDAVEHYRTMIAQLRAHGITPVVTVYHYALPRWVAAHGGWEWDGIVPAIEALTRRVGAAFGDQVDTWITINEPNAIAAAGYGAGFWPPGVNDMRRSLLVYATLMRAHARMTAALREADTRDGDGDGRATFIGMAHNLTPMQPATTGVVDRTIAAMADDLLNEMVPRAARTGWIRIHVPGLLDLDEHVPALQGSFDYLGVNYFHRQHLRADLTRAQLAALYVPHGLPSSDNGWEQHPEGLYQMLTRFKDVPIVVTENGIADAEDRHRAWFLRGHLYAIQRAIAEGVDVRGYFHWTLMDNFEWDKGYALQFGLFTVDRVTLERRPRPSAEVFREAARGVGLHPAN